MREELPKRGKLNPYPPAVLTVPAADVHLVPGAMLRSGRQFVWLLPHDD
jgi:hypothetical protein